MNSILWLNIEEGVSQKKRLLNSLLPGSIAIDGRSFNDLLAFVAYVAKGLNYYDRKNEKQGDWFDFFLSDFSIFIALIGASYPVDRATVDAKLNKLIHSRDFDTALGRLNKYREAVYRFSQQLIDFYGRYSGKSTGEDAILVGELGNAKEKIRDKIEAYNMPIEQPSDETRDLDYIDGEREKLTAVLQDVVNTYDTLRGLANFYRSGSGGPSGNDNPHISLLKTFLHLFSHLQAQLNNFTGRHLDYYYNKVLKTHKTGAVADKVHVFFMARQAASSVTVSTGDVLIAENRNNKIIKYAVTQDLDITTAQIERLYTLYISDNVQITGRAGNNDIKETVVYTAEHPVSADGDLTAPWPVFGEDQREKVFNATTMQLADIGFAIGSPIFFQQEGTREFYINLTLAKACSETLNNEIKNFASVLRQQDKNNGVNDDADDAGPLCKKLNRGVGNSSKAPENGDESRAAHEMFAEAFVIQYTAADGWADVLKYTLLFKQSGPDGNSLNFHFRLYAFDKPVDIYSEEKHGAGFKAGWPLIRFLVNNKSLYHPFIFLRPLLVERITAKITTSNFSSFQLVNNNGPLSPAAPFQPFGPFPVKSSFFQLKNSNVFNRFTTTFSLNMEWQNLPPVKNGFTAYYAGYDENITNKSFKISLSSSAGANEGRNFNTQGPVFDLFEVYRDVDENMYMDNKTNLSDIDADPLGFNNNMLLGAEKQSLYSGREPGAIKLELISPSVAFGHDVYVRKMPEALLQNAKKGKKVTVPPTPYTPVIKQITAKYTLQHSEVLSGQGVDKNAGSDFVFYQLHPFGLEKVYPSEKGADVYLVPQLTDAGNLMIGLKNLNAGEELALLFLFGNNMSADAAYDPEEVTWTVLCGNAWLPVGDGKPISDSTNNLTEPGIVKLKIPGYLSSSSNTILSPGLNWLRASIKQQSKIQSAVTGIFTQATEAERVLMANYVDDAQQMVIPPGSIKRFDKKIGGIQKILQPAPSFGGKEIETNEKYYIRTSERLRHRNRPQTALDIAQIILEAFAEIMVVKCITKNEMGDNTPNKPDLTIVIVPKFNETPGLAAEEPKASFALLYKTEQFIKSKVSPFISVKVCNPVYENVKIFCKIKFNTDLYKDNGTLKKKLNEDITKFICPWVFNKDEEIIIGSKPLYAHGFLYYLTVLPYVDKIEDFTMLHFYTAEGEKGELSNVVEEVSSVSGGVLQVSTPRSILVPSASHIFDGLSPGVGSLVVGEEFVLGQNAAPKKLHKQSEQHTPEAGDEDRQTKLTFIINL